MGWLSTLSKIGAIASVPLAGITMGASAPLTASLLAGAFSAGSNVLGADMASRASKSAAKTQADAGLEAKRIEQQGQRDAIAALSSNFQGAQGLYAPYQQAGQSALPSLTALAGSGYRGAGTPISVSGQPQGMYASAPTGQPSGFVAPRAPMPQPQQQEPMVTLISPTGQRGQVPASQAEHFIAKGAKRIG